MREEKDNIGKINIPDEALYGIYTLRALDSFPITGERINLYLIKAFYALKKAACIANYKTGKLAGEKYTFIDKAVKILAEETDKTIAKESFSVYEKIIVDPYNGGAGMSLDMNINEIIANTALQIMGKKNGQYEIIHPMKDVNLSQSVNSVFPAALKIASVYLLRELADAFSLLKKALSEKEKELRNIIKPGRTRLQDAEPVTLGHEFGIFAGAVERAGSKIGSFEPDLLTMNPGVNDVNNIMGPDAEYLKILNEELKNITGLPVVKAEKASDRAQNVEIFAAVHGCLKNGAVVIIKMCQDLRLLSGGPSGGLGEIILPSVLPDNRLIPSGSDPAVLENAIQVSELIKGHDQVISDLASSGNLESNAFMPVIAHLLLKSAEMMRDSVLSLTEKCIRGIEADEKKCMQNLLGSYAIADSLVNIFGHEKIKRIVTESEEKGINFLDLLRQKKILSEKELIGLISREMGIKGGKNG